jgi:hypothetical protein
MKKRTFLKQIGLGSLALAGGSSTAEATGEQQIFSAKAKRKFWIWINPDHKATEEALTKQYKEFQESGITGIFFEADDEKHFTIAKKQGLETHRWIWTMNRGEESLLKSHPEMYAVSRKGDSCATKPPYVDYYRWLCPSKPETKAILKMW